MYSYLSSDHVHAHYYSQHMNVMVDLLHVPIHSLFLTASQYRCPPASECAEQQWLLKNHPLTQQFMHVAQTRSGEKSTSQRNMKSHLQETTSIRSKATHQQHILMADSTLAQHITTNGKHTCWMRLRSQSQTSSPSRHRDSPGVRRPSGAATYDDP